MLSMQKKERRRAPGQTRGLQISAWMYEGVNQSLRVEKSPERRGDSQVTPLSRGNDDVVKETKTRPPGNRTLIKLARTKERNNVNSTAVEQGKTSYRPGKG